jgi:hypothetical protein
MSTQRKLLAVAWGVNLLVWWGLAREAASLPGFFWTMVSLTCYVLGLVFPLAVFALRRFLRD